MTIVHDVHDCVLRSHGEEQFKTRISLMGCLCMRTMHSKVSVVDRIAIKRSTSVVRRYDTEEKK